MTMLDFCTVVLPTWVFIVWIGVSLQSIATTLKEVRDEQP